MSEPVDRKDIEIMVRLSSDGRGHFVASSSNGGDGISSGWLRTPEAAMAMWAEKARCVLEELSGGHQIDADNLLTFVALSKVFR